MISIIIPTYNRSQLVCETVESIYAQDFQDFQVIVVDDGSSDDTKQKLGAFTKNSGFQYIYQKNQGRSTARNHGLSRAAGDFVMFLDSDDLLAPHGLKVLSEVARRNPDSSVIAGGRLFVDETKKFVALPDELAIKKEFFNRQIFWEKVRTIYFCMGSYIIKKELAQMLNGFNAKLEPCEDFDFFIRYCNHSKISAVKSPIVYIRQHQDNTPPLRLFNALMNIAQQNYELLANNPENHSPDLLKKIRIEWQLKMANDFYSFGDNSQAFEHFWTAIKIEPKLLLDKSIVKSTLLTNFSPHLREKLKSKLDFRTR